APARNNVMHAKNCRATAHALIFGLPVSSRITGQPPFVAPEGTEGREGPDEFPEGARPPVSRNAIHRTRGYGGREGPDESPEGARPPVPYCGSIPASCAAFL